MPRIVVSFAKLEKVRKYKEALQGSRGSGARGLELVDAWSQEPPYGDWAELLEGADGLLLTGGSDVEPWRYGETEHPEAEVEKTPARDEMEWSLLEAARAERLPVLGICRGHQAVNAFLGGTLWQDLAEVNETAKASHDCRDGDRRRPAHGIEVVSAAHPLGELLASAGELTVNSLHHQAVRDPGAGMATLARGPGGIVEATALEDPDWWVWSVQWHPEELVEPADAPVHRELFDRFLEAAEGVARRRRGATAVAR